MSKLPKPICTYVDCFIKQTNIFLKQYQFHERYLDSADEMVLKFKNNMKSIKKVIQQEVQKCVQK